MASLLKDEENEIELKINEKSKLLNSQKQVIEETQDFLIRVKKAKFSIQVYVYIQAASHTSLAKSKMPQNLSFLSLLLLSVTLKMT